MNSEIPSVKNHTGRLLMVCFVLLLSSCGKSPEQRISAGLEALEEGKPARAIRTFEKAVPQIEESMTVALLWNAMGVAASTIGNEEQAEASFTTAIESAPEWGTPYLNLGMLYWGQGREAEALSALSRAAEVDPIRTEALELQSALAVRAGDEARALEWMRQAYARSDHARTSSSLAVLSRDVLPLDQRRDLLQQAVTRDPEFAPAHVNLAALLDQHRLDPEQARAHYEAYLRLEPESPLVPQVVQRAQVMQARAASGQGIRPDPVREQVEEFLQQAAAADDTRTALALCLRAHAAAARASRSDLRERALRAATALAPDSARARVGLGRLLQEQGRTAEGLEEFRSALQLAGRWPPAVTGFVECAVSAGETGQATDLLEEMIHDSEDVPMKYLLAGDLFLNVLQEPGRAGDLYARLVSEFPDSAEAQTARQRLP